MPCRRRSTTRSILQIKIPSGKRLSQSCSRHEARQIEWISIRYIQCVERQIAEKGARDREAIWLRPEREGIRVRVTRRGCRDEVGRERLGDGGEGIKGRAVTRHGSVDGGQAWEHVVQDFDDIRWGAGVGVDHDG